MKANTDSNSQMTYRRRRPREAQQQVADQYEHPGGVMRIKQVTISVILALTAAGSIAAGSALPAAAASAPVASHAVSYTYYHG
jgi:uncharacterized protein (DUF2062 family)